MNHIEAICIITYLYQLFLSCIYYLYLVFCTADYDEVSVYSWRFLCISNLFSFYKQHSSLGVLWKICSEKFRKFTRKHLCWPLFLSCRPNRCVFLWIFAKFSGTTFLLNIYEQLLLKCEYLNWRNWKRKENVLKFHFYVYS